LAGSGCLHEETEFLGEQKAEKGVNRYFRCKKCGSVIILSEDNIFFEIKSRKSRG
jgi:ribosomal protein S26